MITENVSTLRIHKLTQAQYDRELAAGNIDEYALYLTPDEEGDLSNYVNTDYAESTYETKNDASNKLKEAKQYTDTKFESMESSVNHLANTKANSDHTHDIYVTKLQFEELGVITIEDIDNICNGVTEEGLPQSDIDELMTLLGEV